MTFNDSLRERQTKSGPYLILRRKERLEDVREDAFWNSMTVVSDYKMRLAPASSKADAKSTVNWKRIESIGHQVRDDLKNLTAVYFGTQTVGHVLNQVNCLPLKRFPVDSERGFH
jgi:hypothetical protein